jgi:membrane protein implicated in regulation of membrane protease activity
MAGGPSAGVGRPGVAQEIATELEATRQRLTDLRQERSDPWPVLGLLAIVVFIEILALWPSFIILWVVGSFTLYCYSFLLFFMPTTQDRKRIGKAGAGSLKADAIKIAKKRRVVIAMAYFRCFLYNAEAQAMAFVVIFSISMMVGAIALYVDAIDVASVMFILISSLLIMSFYAFVMRFRPYTPAYADKLRQQGLKLVDTSKEGWLKYLPFALGSFFVLAAALIAALLVPGLTLSKFVNFWQFNLGANIFTYLLTVVIQYFIVRSIQSIESKRVAIAFLENRASLLQETLAGNHTEEEMRVRLSTLRIYRVDRHDFFRYFPVYNVNPNIAGVAASGDIDKDIMQRLF